MEQQKLYMERQIIKTVRLNYLLYLPIGYDINEKVWPLILFLHGAGETGEDLDIVKRNGLPSNIENGQNYPFIIISPQCPENAWWMDIEDELMALLDEIIENYRVDTKRIYLTGLSMGGYGTWHIAASHPEKFAAIAPVCGGGLLEDAPILKNIPIWAFHGDSDDVVLPEESQKMVDAVRELGGDVKFTLYKDVNHNSWTPAYNDPELYKWFLQHTL